MQAQEHRVGLFFDQAAQSCVGEIRNYNQDGVLAYLFALVPDGTDLNGALVGLDLPPGIFLVNRTLAKDVNVTPLEIDAMTSSSGADFTLQRCPVTEGPVLLATLKFIQVDDRDPPQTQDINLILRGGVTAADSLRFDRPQVKICDPDDPIGGTPELQEALSLRATLNCSSHCPCEVSVVAKTWGAIKKLFREP